MRPCVLSPDRASSRGRIGVSCFVVEARYRKGILSFPSGEGKRVGSQGTAAVSGEGGCVDDEAFTGKLLGRCVENSLPKPSERLLPNSHVSAIHG